jgi:uncharacterized Tic20 family protein
MYMGVSDTFMEPPPLVNSPASTPTGNDKIWCILCHLSSLIGVGLVLPLVVFLAMKNESQYVRDNAREALNCHISVLIYMLCSMLLVFVGVGILMVLAVGVAVMVFSIIAAVKSSEGRIYRYPLILRLVS